MLLKEIPAATDLDMSSEDEDEVSTLARLASNLWMAEASEVGLAAEPETRREKKQQNISQDGAFQKGLPQMRLSSLSDQRKHLRLNKQCHFERCKKTNVDFPSQCRRQGCAER